MQFQLFMTFQTGCARQMDVGLILDISGSVEIVMDYVVALSKAIAIGLPISSSMARVGVVSFSATATLNFDLTTYQVSESVSRCHRTCYM